MQLKKGYTLTLDFWALGIYIFELAVHEPPFTSGQIKIPNKYKTEILKAEKNRNWKNSNLSPELKDLINSLLKFDPQERLGVKNMDEIKKHDFFKDFDW